MSSVYGASSVGMQSANPEEQIRKRNELIADYKGRDLYKEMKRIKDNQKDSFTTGDGPATPTYCLHESKRSWKYKYERWRRDVREFVVQNSPDFVAPKNESENADGAKNATTGPSTGRDDQPKSPPDDGREEQNATTD